MSADNNTLAVKEAAPTLKLAMKALRSAVWVEPGNAFVTPDLHEDRLEFFPVQVSVDSFENPGEQIPLEAILRKTEHGHVSCRKIGHVTLYTPSFLPWESPTIYFRETVIPDIVTVYNKIVGLKHTSRVLRDKVYADFLQDILDMHQASGEYTPVRGSFYQGLSLLYELGILAVLDARADVVDPNETIPVVMLKIDDEIDGPARHYYKNQVISILASGVVYQEGWSPAFAELPIE